MSHEGFLREICEHPDDDAPRLIYADWLDENGQPDRAEFIRVQIELAGPPGENTKKRRNHLERRVRQLWKKHGKTWSKQPGSIDNLDCWERGFSAYYWVKDCSSLFAELPLRLTQTPIRH